MRSLLLTCLIPLLTVSLARGADDAAVINKLVKQLNNDAKTPAGEARALQSISKSTGVPVAKLQAQKKQTGWTAGDLYAGHAIASAAGKDFSHMVTARRGGQTWAQILEANRVSLAGSGSRAGKKQSQGDKVGENNARDRQQAVPSTSRVGTDPAKETSNPANRWP